MTIAISYVILQALTGEGLNIESGGGILSGYKSLALIVGGIGLLFGGLAVVKELTKSNGKGKEAVVGFFVAIFVFYIIFQLL